MAERGLVLGTAGHIDHGKTVLVEALTGRKTDRLPEERRRGISIELGFAELTLPDDRSLSVVDVPGHERLVRTMVAGASGIDLFLMIVACDDGVMPQTREHWTVLQTLGITHGVGALTKSDLADGETRNRARTEAGTLMPDIPLVAVSARTGQGIEELRAALALAASEAENDTAGAADGGTPNWPEPAVLHIDRVFSVRGAGTVVTGTLWSGQITRGEQVEVLPRGLRARVRAIETHDRETQSVAVGWRVALNLAGVARDEVGRGDVVCSPGTGLAPTYRLDCRLIPSAEGEIRAAGRVQVHHGTRDVPARIVALDSDHAQLRLEEPLLARAGDRVVVRQIAPPATLGGGVIVDAHPRRHGHERGAELARLIGEAAPEALLQEGIEEARGAAPAAPADWSALPVLGAARARFAPERWRETIERLVAQGELGLQGGLLVNAGRAEPGTGTSTPSARELSVLARALLRLLREDGPAPRAPEDLALALQADRAAVLGALDELVASGETVLLRPGVYYAHEALAALADDVLERVSERGSISLAELRDQLGTSRKYAQALLEHLDGEHLLIRRGDRHFPRRRRADQAGRGA